MGDASSGSAAGNRLARDGRLGAGAFRTPVNPSPPNRSASERRASAGCLLMVAYTMKL